VSTAHASDLRLLSAEGLWQVVEYADYSADLTLWRRLAESAGGRILDLGCGVGRVAHDLATSGWPVTGVDIDPGLVTDFSRIWEERTSRSQVTSSAGNGGMPDRGIAEAVCADVASPELGKLLGSRRFDLVIAPQQFVQLLTPDQRLVVLETIRDRLAPGGMAAFAICEELPATGVDFPGVLPDAREDRGWYHVSVPLSIEPDEEWITSSRRRDSVSPSGDVRTALDETRIHRIDRQTLGAELSGCGLEMIEVCEIPQTERHMGSTALVARRRAGPDHP
jgi:SAM-dependent methyltransferase